MELRSADQAEIAPFREESRRGSSLTIVPGFHSRLISEAESFIIEEQAAGVASPLGYVSLLERVHAGHSHATVVELYLAAAHQTRYEDALDLVRETHKPTAYLVRTDDCRLNATLLARGHQVEATALVMLPEEGDRPPLTVGETPEGRGLGLAPFTVDHLGALGELVGSESTPGHPDPSHAWAELETLAREETNWVVLQRGRPVAVIARLDGGDGVHELLDFALARAGDEELALALRRAAEIVRGAGRRPAAVIDATERSRRRIFRKAGYYSAAAYMVFYDAAAGRPSVGTLSVGELQAMIANKERFRLVDVLGEEHWKEAHLPGSEWIDFKGMARESRRRFSLDEPLVLYCNGFACEASAIAADKLRQLGFTNVRDFAGGLEEWTAAGLKLEKA